MLRKKININFIEGEPSKAVDKTRLRYVSLSEARCIIHRLKEHFDLDTNRIEVQISGLGVLF